MRLAEEHCCRSYFSVYVYDKSRRYCAPPQQVV